MKYIFIVVRQVKYEGETILKCFTYHYDAKAYAIMNAEEYTYASDVQYAVHEMLLS